MEIRGDHHVALEFINCFAQFDIHHEEKVHGLLDKIQKCNVELTIIKDLINKLSHAKHGGKQVDFSQDEEMKRRIIHVHKSDPSIFDSLVKNFPDYIPEDDDEVSAITVDGVLDHSLKNVDMSRINIDVLKEDEIDVVVQGLEGMIKSHTTDLHHYNMKLTDTMEGRSHVMEITRLGIKEDSEHKRSITRKAGSH